MWCDQPDTIASAQEYIPHAETLDEACYLVSRGVRPLALAGVCPDTPVVMTTVRTVLHRATQAELTIPFVFPERGNPGIAAFGYAVHRWCIDLLEWAMSGEIPPARKHEIIGPLCGYSATAIARHRELDHSREGGTANA